MNPQSNALNELRSLNRKHLHEVWQYAQNDNLASLSEEDQQIAKFMLEHDEYHNQFAIADLLDDHDFDPDKEVNPFEIVKTSLDKIGMSFLVEELELKLNRAAEEATPKAKALFVQAIKEMTFEDVMNIYNGPDDSATRYFQGKMTDSLAGEMKPIINNSLSQVGAVKIYDDVMANYRSIPFVPDIKANLTDYVTQKGMDGIFHYMAEEEKPPFGKTLRNRPQSS